MDLLSTLLDVTLLAPMILRWLPDFGQNCAPLIQGTPWTTNSCPRASYPHVVPQNFRNGTQFYFEVRRALIYSATEKDGLNFVSLYFLNYT